MKIDITVHLEPEELQRLLVDVDELQKWFMGHIEDLRNYVDHIYEFGAELNVPKQPEQEEETLQEESSDEPQKQPTQQEYKEPPQEVTLEDVRAKLGALTKQGKQSEVKSLIENFGGSKLSDIPEEKYPELIKAAEEI